MAGQLERDVTKFLILALYGAIVANLLSNGQVTVQLMTLFRGIIGDAFRVAAGQRLT